MSRYTDYFTNNITGEHAMLFDQTFSLPPTTLFYGGSQTWTHTYVSNQVTAVDDSFMPGQKSWQFRLATSSSNANRIRTNSATVLGYVSDNSYSVGAWIKVDNFPSIDYASATPITFYAVRPSTRGFAVAMYQQSTTGLNTLFVTLGDKSYFFTSDNYPTLAANTWNYLAIRRDGANAYIYLNGTLINSDTSVAINTTANMTGYDFGNTQLFTYAQIINIASPYIGGYSTIGATEISNIWNYGSKIQAQIKYWDGSTWSNSTGSKVYHSGGWQDIYASRFDGTNWVPL